MAPVPRIPEALKHGPFRHATALQHGVTPDMLSGRSWKRIHPGVWVHRDHVMSQADHIVAASLSMPDRAHVSHESRLQLLGLDIGGHDPIHLTIAGDHHLATKGVFLHRTEVLPPVDAHGVTPAAAFIQFCSTATLLDAIIAGDWLLHREHMTSAEVVELAHHHDWRPGSRQALSVLRHLDGRSRSPKESEVRALMVFAGLPAPEVNAPVMDCGHPIATADLLLEPWRLVLEYEGRQHALDTTQFQIDITRYARIRQASYEYVQITHRMTEQPRALVVHIHQALSRRGYVGPAPDFGARWASLRETVSVPPRLRAVS